MSSSISPSGCVGPSGTNGIPPELAEIMLTRIREAEAPRDLSPHRHLLCFFGFHDLRLVSSGFKRCAGCEGTSEWIHGYWDFLPRDR